MSFMMAMKLVIILSIVLFVFSLALRAKAHDATFLLRNPGLGLRSFVAMFVIMPLAAILLVWLLNADPAVEIAIVALSLSPVPPLLPSKQMKAGGSSDYVTGLLVSASVVCLIVAPLWLYVLSHLAVREFAVMPASIVAPLVMTIGFPLAVGLIVSRFMQEDTRQRVSGVIGKVAMVLLVVSALVLLVVMAPALWKIVGDGQILVLVAFIVIGLLVGYMLAGPPQYRPVLALASATRHPGAAIALSTASFPDERLVPAAIIMFVLINAVVGVPLLRLITAHDHRAAAPQG